MDGETLDLFLDNLDQLDELSASQLADIVVALEAYDFPAGSDAAAWRDNMVTALKAGDFATASSGAATLVMGTVQLTACP